jgi:hypothetical protein
VKPSVSGLWMRKASRRAEPCWRSGRRRLRGKWVCCAGHEESSSSATSLGSPARSWCVFVSTWAGWGLGWRKFWISEQRAVVIALSAAGSTSPYSPARVRMCACGKWRVNCSQCPCAPVTIGAWGGRCWAIWGWRRMATLPRVVGEEAEMHLISCCRCRVCICTCSCW